MQSSRLATSSSFTSPREDNTQDNDHQPTMPLGVELTGYRLLTTGVILGFGIAKAVYSYKGQALISTTLDWLAGAIFAVILFWLGEAKRPGLFPRFYEDDLAPPILRFLRRPEVHLWFLSALLLLINTMELQALRDVRRKLGDFPAYVIALRRSVLALNGSICIFCLQCVRVIRPGVFRGLRFILVLTIHSVVWLLYFYAVVRVVPSEECECYPLYLAKVAVHNSLWMYPLTFERYSMYTFDIIALDTRTFEGVLVLTLDLLITACVFLIEAYLIGFWGFPNFPGGLCGIFLSSCLMVFFSYRFFASVPTSWVTSFADMWNASKAAYNRVRNARNNTSAHVLQ